MKSIKKFILFLYISLISLTIIVFLQIGYYSAVLPDNFYRENNQNDPIKIKQYPLLSVMGNNYSRQVLSASTREKEKMTVMLYGIIPVKNVTVSSVDSPKLIPAGDAFGLKMLTKGVMVTDYGEVDTEFGQRSPAKEAGLLVGDIIISVNGIEICSGSELTEAVQADENTARIIVIRKGKQTNIDVIPEKSQVDGLYKLGIWTRDSCAGIGTLTYYDPKNMSYGGLGHSVCDSDTGEMLPLASGETVPVCINSIIKGINGSPGELCGSFMSSTPNGSILKNTECGIFGFTENIPDREPLSICLKQDIEIGEAQIITTLNGMTPKAYDILIEKVNYNSDSNEKNMIIKITDPDLISQTGGIVQGMSGSPIIQNGKIAGAVTHVFVNDITRGYGIFVENMYSISSEMINTDITHQIALDCAA